MAEQQNIKVFSNFVPGSGEEWMRALKTPVEDLPQLSDSENARVKKEGLSEDEIIDRRRNLLLQQLKEERVRKMGLSLGGISKEVMSGLGPQYELKAAIYEPLKSRWMLRIVLRRPDSTPESVMHVAVPGELADELVQWKTLADMDRLKELILRGVGREELIVRREK